MSDDDEHFQRRPKGTTGLSALIEPAEAFNLLTHFGNLHDLHTGESDTYGRGDLSPPDPAPSQLDLWARVEEDAENISGMVGNSLFRLDPQELTYLRLRYESLGLRSPDVINLIDVFGELMSRKPLQAQVKIAEYLVKNFSQVKLGERGLDNAVSIILAQPAFHLAVYQNIKALSYAALNSVVKVSPIQIDEVSDTVVGYHGLPDTATEKESMHVDTPDLDERRKDRARGNNSKPNGWHPHSSHYGATKTTFLARRTAPQTPKDITIGDIVPSESTYKSRYSEIDTTGDMLGIRTSTVMAVASYSVDHGLSTDYAQDLLVTLGSRNKSMEERAMVYAFEHDTDISKLLYGLKILGNKSARDIGSIISSLQDPNVLDVVRLADNGENVSALTTEEVNALIHKSLMYPVEVLDAERMSAVNLSELSDSNRYLGNKPIKSAEEKVLNNLEMLSGVPLELLGDMPKVYQGILYAGNAARLEQAKRRMS